MRLVNITQKTCMSETVREAGTFLARLKGLLGERSLPPKHAFVLYHCRSIHMLGMRFPLDAIFVDKSFRIVHLTKNLRPFMLSPYISEAYAVIEAPVGTIDASLSSVGDQLALQDD